jgi:hypothetical protein
MNCMISYLLSAEKQKVLIHKHIFPEPDCFISSALRIVRVLKETLTSPIRSTLSDNNSPQDTALPFEIYPTFIQCDMTKGTLRTQDYKVQCRHQDSKKIGRMLEKELLLTAHSILLQEK